ncbi:MAG: RNA-binding protein [Pseudomonadota bacterium]
MTVVGATPTVLTAIDTFQREVSVMGNKLYIGGLSWGTTEENLRQAFSQFGDLSEVSVAEDRYSGRSRGFGFITFVNAEDAQKAMSEMNGKTLDGREIKVDEATERPRKNKSDYQSNNRNNRGHGGGRRRY